MPIRFIPDRHFICGNSRGVATLTVGCLFPGILDIYGTDSGLGTVYWIAGPPLLVLALLPLLRKRGRTERRQALS